MTTAKEVLDRRRNPGDQGGSANKEAPFALVKVLVALISHTEVVVEIGLLQGEGTNSLGKRKVVGEMVRNNNGDVARKRQGERSRGLKSGTWRVSTIQFTEEIG